MYHYLCIRKDTIMNTNVSILIKNIDKNAVFMFICIIY